MGGGASFGINNQPVTGGSSSDCSGFSLTTQTNPTPCFSSVPSNVTVTCNNPSLFTDSFGVTYTACVLVASCPTWHNINVIPFCYQNSSPAVSIIGKGTTVIFGAGGAILNQPSVFASGSFFVSNDFTIIIIGLIGLAVLGTISVFGTQFFSVESAHIVFVVGGLSILWAILTLASGFGSTTSFWGQLNAASNMNGQTLSLGSLAFTGLSLVYFIGMLRAVSRGA